MLEKANLTSKEHPDASYTSSEPNFTTKLNYYKHVELGKRNKITIQRNLIIEIKEKKT